jgi:FK506-binding protein 2
VQSQLTNEILTTPKEQLGNDLIRQKYRDLTYGLESQSGDVLSVLYTGRLINGTIFDTNTTGGRSEFSFTLGSGSVIKGFDLGLIGASLGDIYHLEIPSSLGYGSTATASIPANSTLLFDIEIRGITRGVSRFSFQNSIGNIADKFTLRKDGKPVYSGMLGSDWKILAAERISEVNQVLWKNIATNKLLVWAMDSSWSWTSTGALIDPLSGTAKEVESQFGVDINSDGSIFTYKTGTTSVDVITGSSANEFFAPLGVGTTGVDRIILGGGSNQIQLQVSGGGNLYSNGKESDFLIVDDFNILTDQLLLAANRSYGFFTATVGADSGLAIYEDKNVDKLYNNSDEVLAWLKGVTTMPANSLLLG